MATLSIDKSNWELVRLGDVAHEVRESLTKSDVQVDRSVGLEHIEPGDLHIRTWDELDESSSFTKVFREGHVLFGRRRAYLKKAALADFNGVCSGDITVISANEDLLPSLLPFVVSSDRFFAFAVEHSAGGLSPRVKWKDLANYEFLLPPKDQQAEIAELLWATDEYLQAMKMVQVSIERRSADLYSAKFLQVQPEKTITLGDLYQNKLKSLSPEKFESEVDHYSLPAFLETGLPEHTEGRKIASNKLLIDRSVVLYSKLNPENPKVWIIPESNGPQKLGSTEWLPVIPNERLSAGYVASYLSSSIFHFRALRLVQGSSNSHQRINPKAFYRLQLPVVPYQDINDISSFFESLETTRSSVKTSITDSQKLFQSLINQLCSHV